MVFFLDEWKEDYIKDVAQIANNKKIADKLRDGFPYPYTLEAAKSYVTDCISKESHNQLCRAIIVDGRAVGSVGVFVKKDVYHKSAELGYWLGEEFWGNGIMSKAVQLICKEAFEKFDLVRIFAEPYSFNTGSVRVLEKAGFLLEGVMKSSVCKHNKIYDSCMYALVKGYS